MNQTINTLIAFVIVIIGLSSLLQILTNSLKNMSFFKWRTYLLFLRTTYVNLLSDDLSDSDAAKTVQGIAQGDGQRPKRRKARGGPGQGCLEFGVSSQHRDLFRHRPPENSSTKSWTR